MAKTIIVGNALTLKGSGLGSVIDGHQTVVRINAYRTRGHESDVGTKCDIWIIGICRNVANHIRETDCTTLWMWSGGEQVDKRKGWSEFLDKVPAANWPLNRRNWHDWTTLGIEVRRELHACGIADNGQLWPSTGLVAVLLVHKLLADICPAIVGFGPRDKQEDGHYYDPREGVFGRMHNWEAERHFLNRWEQQGLVRRLDG